MLRYGLHGAISQKMAISNRIWCTKKNLAQDSDQWLAPVSTVIEFLDARKEGDFLTDRAIQLHVFYKWLWKGEKHERDSSGPFNTLFEDVWRNWDSRNASVTIASLQTETKTRKTPAQRPLVDIFQARKWNLRIKTTSVSRVHFILLVIITNTVMVVEVKLSLYQAAKSHGVVRRQGFHTFLDSYMAVRLPAIRSGRTFTPNEDSGYSFLLEV
jgi:hypothetical protein